MIELLFWIKCFGKLHVNGDIVNNFHMPFDSPTPTGQNWLVTEVRRVSRVSLCSLMAPSLFLLGQEFLIHSISSWLIIVFNTVLILESSIH